MRLIGAEYRLLGKVLGFDTPAAAGRPEPAQPPSPDSSRPVTPPAGGDPPKTLAIAHASEPEYRRPVIVETFTMTVDGAPTATLYFFPASESGAVGRKATIEPVDARRLRLKIETKDWPPGRWRAAICDAHDVQLGFVEIAL
jgi:hypothetical protein